ncbi:MAG: Asp23/Gls24 family envelope stress response protein [Streptosporangiaceae bacterium]|nr:Asp23/Gls24 family envelope stress response protein [Streptosporangiaceae bacterium]
MSGTVSDQPDGRSAARPLLAAVTLPCGADIDLLFEQVADGRGADQDAHQRQCVHCQAALSEFSALWDPFAELAATPVPAPPGLVAAVMSQIRTLVRDIWYTLEVTENGVIRIAARIVAALARDCAQMIPGVRVALGRSTHDKIAALAEKSTLGHRHPHAAVGVLGRTAVVDLAVAVTDDDPVHRVARDIQRQVIATLRDQVGLQSVTVNVTVDDIIDDDEADATG